MTTGTVSSTNLTSLYSNTTDFTTGLVNSSVFSVSGGTGVTVNPTTGNVVVAIGQAVGTTSNVQFANVTATGNLSNNYYTLANAVGTNGQVLTTNGAGATSWVTPTDINTTYTINASTTTGGANLNLVGSDASTDTIAYLGSGSTTVTRTDANTITISSTAGTTIPNGTAQGQVLYWNGSAWTADSTITSAAAADRLRLVYNNSTAGVSSGLFLRKDFGASNYTTGDGVQLAFQLDSMRLYRRHGRGRDRLG